MNIIATRAPVYVLDALSISDAVADLRIDIRDEKSRRVIIHPDPVSETANMDQWGTLLLGAFDGYLLDTIVGLLARCPESEWLDRGIDRGIRHLTEKGKLSLFTYRSFVLRNLYFLNQWPVLPANRNAPPREKMKYYYESVAMLAVIVACYEAVVDSETVSIERHVTVLEF